MKIVTSPLSSLSLSSGHVTCDMRLASGPADVRCAMTLVMSCRCLSQSYVGGSIGEECALSVSRPPDKRALEGSVTLHTLPRNVGRLGGPGAACADTGWEGMTVDGSDNGGGAPCLCCTGRAPHGQAGRLAQETTLRGLSAPPCGALPAGGAWEGGPGCTRRAVLPVFGALPTGHCGHMQHKSSTMSRSRDGLHCTGLPSCQQFLRLMTHKS